MPDGAKWVVGLGSNLGDRRGWLRAGVQRIGAIGSIEAVSDLYESDAVGGPAQGPYLNAALRLRTGLPPQELLVALMVIERDLGRERRERWGPRTLDLDVLWADGVVVVEAGLTVPHPRLSERRFALRPLLDVEPQARDPLTGEPYERVLERLAGFPIVRVALAREWPATPEFP